jgi:hypothetical protein
VTSLGVVTRTPQLLTDSSRFQKQLHISSTGVWIHPSNLIFPTCSRFVISSHLSLFNPCNWDSFVEIANGSSIHHRHKGALTLRLLILSAATNTNALFRCWAIVPADALSFSTVLDGSERKLPRHNRGSIPEFPGRAWEEHEKSVRAAGAVVQIRTEHLLHTSQ